MNEYGTLIGNNSIRFERLLPGPIERVWAYLVEPDKRALWLAGGPMRLATGGEVALQFHNAELSRNDDSAPEKYRAIENSGNVYGHIVACDPPYRLIFTWGDAPDMTAAESSEVDIALAVEGESVQLVLTHRRLKPQVMGSVGAGWHTHLGILGDRIDGREPRLFWRTHTALEAEYVERIGLEH
jgi:uncharacterized protein YndB with AHSA1/START domain